MKITFGFKPRVPERLSDFTVCLTGFSGYVGTHLLDTLRRVGVRPFLIARPGTEKLFLEGAMFSDRWENPEELAVQLARFRNPIVINIAGHFINKHQPNNIDSLISGNLHFPLQVFEAMKLINKGAIVNVGTSWEYSELGEPSPVNLYATLKASNAKCLEWYCKEAKIRAVNLKLNDTFGGADNRSKLLPTLKRNWLSGRKTKLQYEAQLLNLLHIVDVQEGLLAAALFSSSLQPHETCEVFLLGGKTITLGALIKLLEESIAPGIRTEFEDTTAESASLRGVWEGAPNISGWSPRISLGDGLREYFSK